jgi:hypothetical protein
MANFIEVNSNTSERRLVNLDAIKMVIPVVNGDGAIIHFESGYQTATSPTYVQLVTVLSSRFSESKPKVLIEDAKVSVDKIESAVNKTGKVKP